ncbi:unnamed protein product [Parnassius mnemosyne]|uniref:Uncharacterized protein n=1 Tax=Parnassius mnemosyne TaxID=213953 RepID=A0AAV1KHD9_9NEOP
MSVASDLTLNLENPEVLATMPDLQIDPTTLFPDLSQEPLIEKGNQRKVKTQEIKVDTVTEHPKKGKEMISRKDKVKKAAKYKKQDSRQKKKFNSRKQTDKENESKKAQTNKYEFSDCECLICGVLYIEDTSGNDWVQCLICNKWAQDGCIKGKSTLFTCPGCLADCDYK